MELVRSVGTQLGFHTSSEDSGEISGPRFHERQLRSIFERRFLAFRILGARRMLTLSLANKNV
jgi:hypothetical protein